MYTSQAVFEHAQVLWTCAGDTWRVLIYLRRRETEMRAVTVNRLAMILTIRLAVWMVHVDYHRVLNLKYH